MHPITRTARTIGLLLLVTALPLTAQGTVVTRRDLADAYLQVDRVAMTFGLPEARRAEWNRSFDRTTLAFFGGNFGKVLRDMHDLLAQMTGDSGIASPTRQILPLRLEPGQRVLVSGRDQALEISATVMYIDSTLTQDRTLTLRVLDAAGTTLARGTLIVPANYIAGQAATTRLNLGAIINGVGRYRIEATLPGAKVPRTTEVFVMREGAEAARTRLQRAIAALPATVDPQSLAAVRARAALITERPNPASSAQFLADPVALTAAVDREVRALGRGEKPFTLRTGDHWRVVTGPTGPIPMRIYAPRGASLGSRMPVVFALHGAGADENMFFEGYGSGRLKALADSLEFILVSPETNAMMRDIAGFDSTLAVLEREYVIDRATIYVLGHSMGAAATMRLASERRSIVRAAVLLAGGGVPPANGQMSPLLFIGAETDLVIPIARVRASYEAAVAAGAVVEFRQADGWGHTLVVGARLDEAVRWLFLH
jgi:predicted esterase